MFLHHLGVVGDRKGFQDSCAHVVGVSVAERWIVDVKGPLVKVGDRLEDLDGQKLVSLIWRELLELLKADVEVRRSGTQKASDLSSGPDLVRIWILFEVVGGQCQCIECDDTKMFEFVRLLFFIQIFSLDFEFSLDGVF